MSIITILGVITLLLFVIALILFICECTGAALGFIIAGGCSFGVLILVGIIMGVCCNTPNNTLNNTPTALDVYRGKTTLEITYRDSVAIDSTVVYKVR
jgi:hypothetical protein